MTTKPYPPTPELEKMKSVQPSSQAISNFLDWLRHEKQREICEVTVNMDEWQPIGGSIQKLLAEYFQIDLKKVEEERRAILETLRP